ncbi:MAG: hypothetical protein A4S09_16320 [Proteobacteria bacterium SG_bin7]|nr:MAG: hypothetical protein A4S09_16320 [Proteobacteria bacterium SG_bin7]
MIWARPLVSLILTILTVTFLSTNWGNLPPMLFVLNPFNGLWVNGDKNPNNQKIEFSDILGPTQIVYDRQMIPHIYAGNEYDAYFSQGFITALDRLWQMELQSRVVEGTLSEIFGEQTLESDKFMLRSGLNDAAFSSYEQMISNPVSRQAVEAYTAGVNRYLENLRYKDFPVEYKILNIKPRRWRPQYVAFILKLMEFQLSSKTSDLRMSRTLAKFGRKVVDELFPNIPFNNDPIIPKGTPWGHLRVGKKEIWTEVPLKIEELPPIPEANESSGSNNWAVSSQRSTTGFPILANDTHLSYRLPNIFYEIQISYGKNSVYGVSIPGSPGVVIGFNKNIAWGVTNGYTDIVDWYKIDFKDKTKKEYRYGNEWKKTEFREYQIRVRDGKPITERVAVTLHGPIVYDLKEKPLRPDFGQGLALKYGTVYPGNELNSFLLLGSSRNYYEARMALQTYHSPSMNFVIADNSGRIGMIHRGLFPKKKVDQGRFVMEGKNPSNTWKEFLNADEVPQVSNPNITYLYSANQSPVDENFPYYLGAEWDSPYRATRIGSLLRSKGKWSPLDFVRMHNDDYSSFVNEVLPSLVEAVNEKDLDVHEKGIYRVLSRWRYRFSADSLMPVVLETWVTILTENLWEPRFGAREAFQWPPPTTLSYLLMKQPNSSWFDNPKTKEAETLTVLATTSFKKTINKLVELHGDDIKNWKWGKIQKTQFPHIAKIPGFGRQTEDVGGSRYSIFANRGDHGPVFRMVVSLGNAPQAWIIVPGGPSGNPFSRYYDNWFEIWKRGFTKAVNYWPTLDAIKDFRYKLEMSKKSG